MKAYVAHTVLALPIALTCGVACVTPIDPDAGSAGDPVDDNGKADGESQPACVGVRVPGDYASIQAALDAGMKRICLGAHSYASFKMSTSATITGLGATKTRIAGIQLGNISSPNAARGGLDLSGVTVTNRIEIWSPDSAITIRDAVAEGRVHEGAAIYIAGYKSMPNVEVMRTEIVGSMTVALHGATNTVAIHDNEIHGGAANGLTIESAGNGFDGPSGGTITIDNNEIHDMAGTGLALRLSGHWNTTPAATLSYSNNVIRNNRFGVELSKNAYGGDSTIVAHSGNFLEGNWANYAGSATPDDI